MTDWYQQSLTPPDAIECRVRLGLVPERDHAQVMVDLFDPVTRVQLAAWSIPHVPLAQWITALEQAIDKAKGYVSEAVEPF